MLLKPSLLPSVDRLVKSDALSTLVQEWGLRNITEAVRAIQSQQRLSIAKGSTVPTDLNYYLEAVIQWLKSHRTDGYRKVFNLTGTVLHSNLGRAPINLDLAQRAIEQASGSLNLEYDVIEGKRTDRESVVVDRLKQLAGADAGLVVNNNAAAVLLAINSFAKGKSVVVSRSELVEIGGSFRLPEIIETANCRLIEVGTTNRTYANDYSDAISNEVGALLKVHRSNYEIRGFTAEASYEELAAIARKNDIPLIADLGSGALVNLGSYGLPRERTPNELLQHGVDIVTFSGDKLLGGPQAGFAVGASSQIERMNKNPMKRALRIDKFTLVLIDETLKIYEDPNRIPKEIELFRILSTSQKELHKRAEQIVLKLQAKSPTLNLRITSSQAELGSGSLPETTVESVAVCMQFDKTSELERLASQLRSLRIPVITRIANAELVMDMSGAHPINELLANLEQLS